MSFLTIFTAPKPFTDPHIAVIQRNAIRSWLNLGAEVDVLVIGDEPGIADACAVDALRRATHLPSVRRNEQGTPLISSMFELARQHASSPLLLCANADIIFLPDLITAARSVAGLVPAPGRSPANFVMIGRRWDLEIRQELEFSNGWGKRLELEAHNRGQLHAPAGSDYFLFPRQLFEQMPDFAIGRAGWDNWMIYQARQQKWPIIDATPSLTVIHQNHDYSHLPGGKIHYDLPESQQNQVLAGGSAHLYMILDSDRQLQDGRLRRPPLTFIRLLRQAEVQLTPPDGSRKGLKWTLARRLRRLRRRITGSL